MIVVRDATADDRAYVLSTWVESEEDHARLPGDRDTVFAALRGKARALYDRSRVLIAAPEDDAITVLAWLAVDRTASVVHYAYTRRQLRRQGLQRDLVAASALDTLTVTTSRPRRAETLRATFAPLMGWMLACAGEETTK